MPFEIFLFFLFWFFVRGGWLSHDDVFFFFFLSCAVGSCIMAVLLFSFLVG